MEMIIPTHPAGLEEAMWVLAWVNSHAERGLQASCVCPLESCEHPNSQTPELKGLRGLTPYLRSREGRVVT